MSLSPSDVHALDEIASDLSQSDPQLAVLLTLGPRGYDDPARSVRRMRILAVLLALVAYLHAEVGLIRGPAVMTWHGVMLGIVAVVLLVVAGRRAARL